MKLRKCHILLVTLTVILIISLPGCGRKFKHQNKTQPKEVPLAEPLGPIPDIAQQQQPPAPGSPAGQAPAAQPGPFANLEKLDNSEDSCKEFCKSWCPKATHCRIKGMNKIQNCAKVCWLTCRKGVLPKVFANCASKATGCDQVMGCLKDLKKLRDQAMAQNAGAKTQKGQGETGSGKETGPQPTESAGKPDTQNP